MRIAAGVGELEDDDAPRPSAAPPPLPPLPLPEPAAPADTSCAVEELAASAAAIVDVLRLARQLSPTQSMISSAVIASKFGSPLARLRSRLCSHSSKRCTSAGGAWASGASLCPGAASGSSTVPRRAITRAVPSTVRKPIMRHSANSGIGRSMPTMPRMLAVTIPVPRYEELMST